MCLAIPYKIKTADKEWAEVEVGDKSFRASTVLLSGHDLQPGDYLLIHEDLAIGKLASEDALRIIEMVEELTTDKRN